MSPAPGFLIGGAVLLAAGGALADQAWTSFRSPPARPAPVTAPQTDVDVAISGFAFPVTVRVAVGGGITWTNADSVTHTVTFDESTLGADELPAGSRSARRFPSQGVFTYHCDIHPSMTGTVEVVDPSASSPGDDPYADPYADQYADHGVGK